MPNMPLPEGEELGPFYVFAFLPQTNFTTLEVAEKYAKIITERNPGSTYGIFSALKAYALNPRAQEVPLV